MLTKKTRGQRNKTGTERPGIYRQHGGRRFYTFPEAVRHKDNHPDPAPPPLLYAHGSGTDPDSFSATDSESAEARRRAAENRVDLMVDAKPVVDEFSDHANGLGTASNETLLRFGPALLLSNKDTRTYVSHAAGLEVFRTPSNQLETLDGNDPGRTHGRVTERAEELAPQVEALRARLRRMFEGLELPYEVLNELRLPVAALDGRLDQVFDQLADAMKTSRGAHQLIQEKDGAKIGWGERRALASGLRAFAEAIREDNVPLFHDDTRTFDLERVNMNFRYGPLPDFVRELKGLREFAYGVDELRVSGNIKYDPPRLIDPFTKLA